MKYHRNDIKNLISIELLKKGFVVSTKPQKEKIFHILCMNADMTKRVNIRIVKSNTSSRMWTLNEDIENYPDNIFYVFVGYKTPKVPEFFIVPSKMVLDYTDENAKKWLNTQRKDGRPHKNIKTRKFIIETDEKKKYLNRWDLLGL